MVDRFGRVHTDLRISLTDRCNFRCRYCLPEEQVGWLPRDEILSFEEIARLASAARKLGVRTPRLTGGEPLVRPGVTELVRMVAEVGFEDLSLTTNGLLLARLADELAGAGLRRVNVSCDSLAPAEAQWRAIAVDEVADWIDGTLRLLGVALAGRDATGLPEVLLVRAGELGVELLLARPLADAPKGFGADENGRIWRLDRSITLAALRRRSREVGAAGAPGW